MHIPVNSKLLNYWLPQFNPHLSIIANGDMPRTAAISEFIFASYATIACDGAINQLSPKQVIDYVIGDGDSANQTSSCHIRHPYIYNPDQNSNDLTKAVEFAVSHYPKHLPILISAATGKREDHTIANFALLAQYAEKVKHIAMLTDYGIFIPCPPGTTRLNVLTSQQISLFSFNPQTIVNCAELKWPLVNFSFNYLNSGSLNQATTNYLEITASDLIIVYLAFERNSPHAKA
jgi:thiamine pyrophosphokinase